MISVTMRIFGAIRSGASNIQLTIAPFPGLIIKDHNGQKFRVLEVICLSMPHSTTREFLTEDVFGNGTSVYVEEVKDTDELG